MLRACQSLGSVDAVRGDWRPKHQIVAVVRVFLVQDEVADLVGRDQRVAWSTIPTQYINECGVQHGAFFGNQRACHAPRVSGHEQAFEQVHDEDIDGVGVGVGVVSNQAGFLVIPLDLPTPRLSNCRTWASYECEHETSCSLAEAPWRLVSSW